MGTDLTQYETSVEQFFDLPPSAFEKVDCCGRVSWLLFTKGSMEVRKCVCGFVWNACQPTQETLDRFYKESSAMTEWARIKQSDREDLRQRHKYYQAVDFLKEKNVQSLLDVGCGTGKFLSLMGLGVGIDSNDASLDVARNNGINAFNLPLEKMASYDAVTLWGVLEHVKNPRHFIKQCVQHLNPGGYLVVCVPNVNSAVVKALKDDCFTFCPQHLSYFDKRTVVRTLEGLKVVEQYTIETEHSPILKHMAGLDPYSSWPTVMHDQAIKLSNALEEFISESDLGYKIVTIAQK